MTIPLFDGGRDYFLTKAASAKLSSAQKTKEQFLLQQKINLKQTYTDLTVAIKKAEVDELFKKASEMRADIARSKYNNGLMNFDDWDVIENDLITKQKAYLVSLKNKTVSEAAWEQILGIGVL